MSAPVQAQNWDRWAQSFKDCWNREEPVDSVEDDDGYSEVYVLMALLIANGFYAEGGCQ